MKNTQNYRRKIKRKKMSLMTCAIGAATKTAVNTSNASHQWCALAARRPAGYQLKSSHFL